MLIAVHRLTKWIGRGPEAAAEPLYRWNLERLTRLLDAQ
jgi:hypothetical protein